LLIQLGHFNSLQMQQLTFPEAYAP
jgi:hypothetical protein